jgi:hypothetical protein
MRELLEITGFDVLHCSSYSLPIGPWGQNPDVGEVALSCFLIYVELSRPLLEKSKGEELERFIKNVRSDFVSLAHSKSDFLEAMMYVPSSISLPKYITKSS